MFVWNSFVQPNQMYENYDVYFEDYILIPIITIRITLFREINTLYRILIETQKCLNKQQKIYFIAHKFEKEFMLHLKEIIGYWIKWNANKKYIHFFQ